MTLKLLSNVLQSDGKVAIYLFNDIDNEESNIEIMSLEEAVEKYGKVRVYKLYPKNYYSDTNINATISMLTFDHLRMYNFKL